MRELQDRQRLKKLLYSLPSIIILAVLAALLVKGAYGVMQKNWQSASDLERLEEEVVSMREREGVLGESLDRLDTEEGIEEAIRQKFNVIREGEHVAVIVDERRGATTTEPSKGPWYKRVWSVIIFWK